jgi:peptidylprolyl isomerase
MRSSVRVRPIAALSIAVAAAFVLAGCSGSGEPDATTTTAAASLCDSAATSGEASEAVQVTGDVGQQPTATFTAPLEFDELESTVVTEGTGDKISDGDFVEYAVSAFDPATGSYAGGQEFNVTSIVANTVLGGALGCAPIGTRVVATLPATSSASAAVYVIDLLGTVPGAAWGEEQAPVDGFPTVSLDDDGAPTVTLPDGDAPTEVQIETLKQGDGATVGAGDWVAVQYSGVKWSDGSVFDSSWDRGAPSAFQTTGVVPGFQQALEGATVGSQILVVIPPEFGYGTDTSSSSGLGGETLVFVIDVLDTHPATWQ